ncbi:MAG: DoxX family protein [Planctomycetaceae bacterium]
MLEKACPPLGRLLLSTIFLMSAVNKVMNWNQTDERMSSQGMPLVSLLLVGAILFEFCGGLSVLLGWRARFGAGLLVVFLIPTTLIFHDFWTFEGQERQMQMINFMKNTSILGGLLLVIGLGPGSVSLDARRTGSTHSSPAHTSQ